jgi:hypothetical protein
MNVTWPILPPDHEAAPPAASAGEAAGAFGFRRLLTFSPMVYGPPMAMQPTMLEHDRKQAGWSVGRAAWRLGVSVPKEAPGGRRRRANGQPRGVPSQGGLRGKLVQSSSPSGAKSPLGCNRSVVRWRSPRTVQVT